MSKTVVTEKKSLLATEVSSAKGSVASNYGALATGSSRICLIFNDTFLGGKKSSWLAKLKSAGFEVEQASPRIVSVSAPDDMLHRIALAKGSHGAHTMPATRERALHFLLSQFDEALGDFLAPPGPFSGQVSKAALSDELREVGLEGWFWLHNTEAATTFSHRNTYLGLVGLSRKPLSAIRDYFGTQIAWSLLLTNFLTRWMLIPALASAAYTYVTALSYIRTGTLDTPWLPVFSVVLLAWAAAATFSWLRLRRRYERRWLEDVAVSGREDLNADAEYEERVDPDLGEVDFYYPLWKRRVKQATSLCLLALPAMAVMAAGLAGLDLRARLAPWHPPWGAAVAGAATAAAVLLACRGLAAHWSSAMTHWENYPSRSGYDDALAAKRLTFELASQLWPVAYLALLDWPILARARPAEEPRIVDALAVQAAAGLLVLCVWAAVSHALALYVWRERSAAAAAAAAAAGVVAVEGRGGPDFSHAEQAARPAFPGPLEWDCATAALMVYALALAPVCPPAPLVAFVWLLARVLTQAHELVYVYQRPHPHGGRGGRPSFWACWTLPAVALAAVVLHIPLVLFCTTGLARWVPWLTVEQRWAGLLSLEAAALALAAAAWSHHARPAAPLAGGGPGADPVGPTTIV